MRKIVIEMNLRKFMSNFYAGFEFPRSEFLGKIGFIFVVGVCVAAARPWQSNHACDAWFFRLKFTAVCLKFHAISGNIFNVDFVRSFVSRRLSSRNL